jgi:hypothetical protein
MPIDYDQLAGKFGGAAGDAAPADKYDALAAKYGAAQKPAPKPFGQQLNDAISDVPRQLGMFARYGLEGIGGTLDFLSSPIRGTLNAAGMDIHPGSGRVLADAIGLPQPQTAGERVVGDAARTVAGAALPLGLGKSAAAAGDAFLASRAQQAAAGAASSDRLASAADRAARGASGVGNLLSANAGSQLTSAGASGLAGGYTRETGGNDASQLAASLAAGVAAPLAMNGIQSGVSAAARRLSPSAPAPQQIDITINNALQQSGLKLGDLPAQVAQGIRDDVAKAFRTSDQVSPDAVRRLADYRLTGLTPTAAGLTLDPAVVSQQKNLAKLGINSKDQVAQQLGQAQNANNRALTQGLNNLGADTTDDAISGAGTVMGALSQRNARAQDIINGLYSQARDSSGRSALLDHYDFTNRAGDLLHDANVESFLTPDIRNKLNSFATGQTPLTVDIAEQFKTGIGKIQRNSSDGNVRTALGLVRQALDDTPLINQGAAPAAVNAGNQLVAAGGALTAGAQPQSLGQDAIDAFNKARGMNRSWMNIVERTPALQAVRDGVEPDKFVQQFIVGTGKDASVMGVAQLKNSIKSSPEAMDAVRGQITSYLKQRALNGAADEVGNFSQSAYNKALASIGDRKLALFFSPDDINQMKAIGRVASYEQFQPAGSAVNNSNTAGSAGAMLLDRVANSALLSKLPVLGAAIQPAAQNISIGLRANRALNVPMNLAGQAPVMQMPQRGMLLSPAAFMGTESDEDRQRRLLATGR